MEHNQSDQSYGKELCTLPLKYTWIITNRYRKADRKNYDSKNYKIDSEQIISLSVIEDFIQLYKFTDYTNLCSIFGLDR